MNTFYPPERLHRKTNLAPQGAEFANQLDIAERPRRNRRSNVIRGLCCETRLAPSQLIYPLFVHSGSGEKPIASMPDCSRWGIDDLFGQIEQALSVGIGAIVLFPVIESGLKTPGAQQCYDENGLIPRAVRSIKSRFPEIVIITDVALDPYSSDGHDGIISSDGRVLNDETVEILCRQALCQANAGVDLVAPSDMMDGRVAAIRSALDEQEFTEVGILSYTAKYASAFYGPFRNALDSALLSGDKKSYQMDPANAREALRELELDEGEGADMVMVKPAGAYLDIIKLFRENTTLPVAAYQVSGEYLMIKSAVSAGWLDESSAVMESLIGIRRAGADMILSYFALKAAEIIKDSGYR